MAKTAQVTGQMELNFTEQKSPKKRSIAKKSVSKPKKEIKKQIAFSSEHYEKATEIVKEREIIHLGTLMRCLHISAMESDLYMDFFHDWIQGIKHFPKRCCICPQRKFLDK